MNQKEKLKLFRKTPAYKQISRWCKAINCPTARAKERERLSLLVMQRTEEGTWVKNLNARLELNPAFVDVEALFRWSKTPEGHDFWEDIYNA